MGSNEKKWIWQTKDGKMWMLNHQDTDDHDYVLQFNRPHRILDIGIKTEQVRFLKAVQDIMKSTKPLKNVKLNFNPTSEVFQRRERAHKAFKILRVFEPWMGPTEYNERVAQPLEIDEFDDGWWPADQFEPPTVHRRDPPTVHPPLLDYDLEDYDSDDTLPLVSASLRNVDRTMSCPSLHRKR